MGTWNKFSSIILLLITFGLLYLLGPILTPFLSAALLAYLVNPIVNQLMRFHIPRLFSVTLVFIILFLLIVLIILLFIPLIQDQIQILIEVMPAIADWVQREFIPWLSQSLGIEGLININMMKTTLLQQWTKAGGVATQFLNTAVRSGFVLIEWLINLFLIPVVTFYLLRDWKKLIKGIHDLIPRKIEPTISQLMKESDIVLGAFLRGQLLVMLALGIIYAIGLSLIGLKIGIVVGLLTGLLCIIPYLGTIVGVVTASVAAVVQFGQFKYVLLVWLVFVIGQTIESTLLTPNLVGDRIGLHPVAVIFAVLAGGSLFGFFGVLLALPVAAVVMVWLRFLHKHYRESKLYR